jgi:hypothetical protein
MRITVVMVFAVCVATTLALGPQARAQLTKLNVCQRRSATGMGC